jgi:hypothetical protein
MILLVVSWPETSQPPVLSHYMSSNGRLLSVGDKTKLAGWGSLGLLIPHRHVSSWSPARFSRSVGVKPQI